MKKWPAFLLVLPVLMLSACAKVAVSYTLSGDNCVSAEYSMDIRPGNEDISAYTSDIAAYWENFGFSAQVTKASDTTTLSGTKTVECGDMQEAVEELGRWLTKKSSAFSDVEFTYTPSYLHEDFSLKANVSLKDLLRQDESGDIPAAAAQSLLDKAAQSEYKLSISLPGEVVSTNADSQDKGVCTWNLAYGEVTEIDLSATNAFSENARHYEALQATQSRGMLLAVILGAAGFAVLVAVIGILIVRSRRKHFGMRPKAPSGDIVYSSRDPRF